MKTLNFNNIYDWPLSARRIVMGILFLLVFLFGYWWSISPLTRSYQDLVLGEDDLKQQFEMIVVKKEVLQAQVVQFPVFQHLLESWKRQLPKELDLPEELNEILKVGASHHIFFSLFDPGDQMKDVPYWHVPIKMIIVGDYDQLSAFISQLANMPWILEVGNITISDENRNDVLGAKLASIANQQNLLTAEINLGIYYQPSQQELDIQKAESQKPGKQAHGK